MSRARLIVFARAPVLGQVKTRLARDIGAPAALQWYSSLLDALLTRLQDSTLWQLQVAITPDNAAGAPIGPVPGTQVIPQGNGDLGERMARLLAQASSEAPMLIVGSDVPGLERFHVHTALAALQSHALTLGPATDGGYWLIGASTPPAAQLFTNVRWSSPHARGDTLANAQGIAVALLQELEDIDDLPAYQRYLQRQATRT
ncbi:MAG: TIGR04282 family arsenosugar biosynthesis glycosyltransferase [Steroidobacteraceae bacterium]